MMIRASVVLRVWVGVGMLSACVGDESTAFDADAMDAAIADGAVNDGRAGHAGTLAPASRVNMPATVAAPVVAAATTRAHDGFPIVDASTAALIDQLRLLEGARATGEEVLPERPQASTEHDDVGGDEIEGDGMQNRYPGLALASSIAGIRARVGSAGENAAPHGPARVLHDQYSVLALARANDDTLDAASRAWRRRPLRVVTSENEQCRGHVAALELASQWMWQDELFEADAKPTGNELRAALSGMLGDVLAHVVLDEPCRGTPIVVEDPSRSHARIARTLPRVPREREVLDAFRKLPRFAALRAECDQLGQCMEDDPAVPAGRPIDLRAFQFPHDRSVYVAVSMSAGNCGDWGPPMSAIFKLEPGARAPILYRVNDDAELGLPTLLLDAEADGHFELVTTRFAADLELIDESGASQQSWSTTFVGCTC